MLVLVLRWPTDLYITRDQHLSICEEIMAPHLSRGKLEVTVV